MQPVTVRRWEIAAAFVLLTAVFTLTLLWVHRLAARADRLSIANHHVLKEVVVNRRFTVARIHQQDVRSCSSRHKLVTALTGTIVGSRADSRRLLGGALGRDPAARRAILNGLARNDKLLRDLRGADCLSVPPLTSKPRHVP